MKKNKSQVSVLELKKILFTIVDSKIPLCFRCRLLGKMWLTNFMRIVTITENGVVLLDESENKLVTIPELSMIIQFELDGAVHAFEPHYHYTLILN